MTVSKKPNASPEREVQREVTAWLKAKGFSCQVIEAKAQKIGDRWRSSAVKAGTSDIIGTDPNGYSVAIELKAPGKRASFWREGNDRQVKFILDKINNNAFACVIDSVALLDRTDQVWLESRNFGLSLARAYLMDALPKKPKRVQDDGPLFP